MKNQPPEFTPGTPLYNAPPRGPENPVAQAPKNYPQGRPLAHPSEAHSALAQLPGPPSELARDKKIGAPKPKRNQVRLARRVQWGG